MLPLAAEPYRTDGGLEEEFLFSLKTRAQLIQHSRQRRLQSHGQCWLSMMNLLYLALQS